MFPQNQNNEAERLQFFWRRFFRRVFLEDWGTKLIALGITLALWLGVTGLRAPTSVRLRNVLLNTRVSNDMEIVNTPVQEVDIVVTGDKNRIDRLNTRDLVVSVDLTDVKAGDRIVQLTPETVGTDLPNGLKLDEIQPNKIAVRLENVREREIDVKAATEGAPAEGWELYSADVTPAKVRVRGAESIVNSIDSISTEPLNIENRKEGFNAPQTGLNILNPKITVLDTIVDVSVKIGEKRIERLFVVPLKTETQTVNFSVVLFGARPILEKLRADELRIEMQNNSAGQAIPRLIFPEHLQNQIEIRRITGSR